MSCLPEHGKIDCNLCHGSASVTFNKTTTYSQDGRWRITANPLAWGSVNPVVVVLGFSKGENAITALGDPRKTLEDVPYAGKRHYVGRLLNSIGLMPRDAASDVTREIGDTSGIFHFGSLVRCTVEQHVENGGQQSWVSSGSQMLEKFSDHPFGRQVIRNCTNRFLKRLPASVKIVVVFGLGRDKAKGGHQFSYVGDVRDVFSQVRGVEMRWINPVSYCDDDLVVIHVEHFSGRNHLENWLSKTHPRRALRHYAIDAVKLALDRL